MHKSLENSSTDITEAGEGMRLSELEPELQLARNDLRDAEKKLEARHWVAPTVLQHWLQLTYERELQNYKVKKSWVEKELQEAKDGIDLNAISLDMKSLLEEEIAKANIHSVRDIKEAILVKNEDAKSGASDLMIKTDGVNFLETVGVFAAYGIEVDPRHLSLISDFMTCSGFYRPCNRLGMEGPLQQMTFETSKNFMVDAMFMGTGDTLKSPSANIIVGQMYRGGTGSFDIFNRCGEKE